MAGAHGHQLLSRTEPVQGLGHAGHVAPPMHALAPLTNPSQSPLPNPAPSMPVESEQLARTEREQQQLLLPTAMPSDLYGTTQTRNPNPKQQTLAKP